MKNYIVQFIRSDFSKVFYSTFKGDFCTTENIEFASRFSSERMAVIEGDKILRRGIDATGFRGYILIEV